MKDSLTPEESALLPIVADEWIAQQTKPTEESAVMEAVAWLYKKIDTPMPKVVIVDSPKAMIEYCRNELKDPNPESLTFGNASDMGWVAFYDFFDRIGVEVSEDYREYREYAKKGIYDAVAYDEIIVVCRNPVHILTTEAKIPHCTTGPAFLWKDGHGEYFINGRHIDRTWAKKCCDRTLTVKEFTSEKNDELRSAAFEFLGSDFANFVGAEEIDSQSFVHGEGELETITLVRTKKKLNTVTKKPYAWLKRICPSTGTVYMTPTNPDFDTVEEAAKFHRPSWVPMDVPYQWFSRS